jgi:hypothetical protein
MRAILLAVALGLTAAAAAVEPVKQRSFPSAEAAVAALGAAVEKGDRAAIAAVLGDKGMRIARSGDKVIDAQESTWFLRLYRQGHEIENEGDRRAVLLLGEDQLPFPIPLVARGGQWRFDAAEGHEDILSRRIGKTERIALDFLLQVIAGQREYFRIAREPGGVHEYARWVVGDAARRDGLVWVGADGAVGGPLAALGKAAFEEGYRPGVPIYRGYTYRPLEAQGPNAPGGARAYVVDGRMTGGFGMIGCPTRYAVSGVLSYMTNQDGVVYHKDLGKRTAELCRAIKSFNPDRS